LLNAGEIEPGLVAHHWLVRGTNTGQGVEGGAPTGQTITLKGASIIQLEGDKIVSDQCYFDRVAVAEQLQPKTSDGTPAGGAKKSLGFSRPTSAKRCVLI
jgi:hypothetical protein